MTNKLIFIGGIGLGEVPTNGETAKNQVMLKRFREFFDKVYVVDSYHWRSNPFILLKMLFLLVFVRNAKVIVSCHRSGMPVLNFIQNTKFQKNVYYWAIGSGLMDWIQYGDVTIKACKYMKKIVAESSLMVKELTYLGLSNVCYMPNMKPVKITPPRSLLKDSQVSENYKVRFVFLSRIIEEKGCFLIEECCRELNKNGFADKYEVVFYGDVSETPSFIESIGDLPNVSYNGILDLTKEEGYVELSKNDVFLFPTYYPNEGFPGVLIDALISGLPIIATRWKYNEDVVKNGYNGIVIEPEDKDSLFSAMMSFIDGKYNMIELSNHCHESAKQYDVNNVLTKERLQELELI